MHLSLIKRRLSWAMIAIVAAAFLVPGMEICWPAQVYAAGNGPIINWDSSMIYPGQNDGNPWGPVGENAIVHGANFLPNVQLNVILVLGNSNGNPSLCKSPVATVGMVTTSGSGTFLLDFTWPSQAGAVDSRYSVCSVSRSGGLPVSYRDDGPFTVLAASPPSFSISPNTVQPGSTITISGQSWVPPQQVTISITGSSQLLNETQTSSGLNSGTFSIMYTVPASAQAGSYTVNVSASNSVLRAGTQNLSLSVSATPTPTPTATPSPTPSVTPTGTTTAIASGGPGNTPTSVPDSTGSTGTGSSSSGGPSLLILGILGAIALVLLTSIGLIIYMVMHRSPQQQKGVPAPGPVPPGWRPGGSLTTTGYPCMPNGPPGDIPYTGAAVSRQPAGGWQSSTESSSNMYNQATMAAPPASGAVPVSGPRCMNCGGPLLPNAVRCDACGMQTGTGLYPGW